ncbi:Uncharacterized protein BM_BM2284 [Brugia malayi]|uniref:Bm2284 n=2 Tax=Brugia TaxID=6278 RepID=A0A0I9N5D2_BRUMA|nr:Uncharacterized protein BM_BM2284 [Brugia malayi]CTP81269.1 Bm2284 [Brugia malayi]VIO94343.1 Uncharacterized protein BM_BM2284 [Brugia malayi]
MSVSAFEKIIRVRSVDLAVLDESAYYEAIYVGSSVPNRRFYAIESPFRMNSQVSPGNGSFTDKNKSRRRRKRGVCSNITCNLNDVSIVLKKILEKAVVMDAFSKNHCGPAQCSSFETSVNFNNYLTRQLVLTATSVPCPLSRYGKQYYFAKQSIKEICLNQEERTIDDISNELVMWVNGGPEVIIVKCKDEKFILPPFSSFIINDACVAEALIRYGKKFDFILLDPPWENKSVKRKTVYPTYGDHRWMLDLCLPELLKESGLLAIWVTNNAKHLKFTDNMIEYFGFEKIATWRWLKVTNSGEPVYNLNSQHKQPFENIVFASCVAARRHYMNIANEFALISTPSAIHSRKPPLFPVLQALGILEETAEQLELYGRYLLPRTITVGFEAAKLQNERYFV